MERCRFEQERIVKKERWGFVGLVERRGTESLSGKREEEEEEKRRRKFGVIHGIFSFSFCLLYLYLSVEGFRRGERVE